MRATPPSSATELLALWDRAAAAAPAWRDDALLSALHGDEPPRSLGTRNAALLGLRSRLFGPSQSLRCDCPRCDATAEFTIDCDALARELQPKEPTAGMHRLDADGHRVEFRLPDIDDLRRAAEAQAFVPALLRLCVTRCETDEGEACDPAALPARIADALSRRMEALEPGASVVFELACPACGERWPASMDVGQVLWTELQDGAERLVLDVDALARSYGWSEDQVLALSPTRRAAYLQLVGAT